MDRNLLQENRQRSPRTLTIYPQRLLNTADHAHDAKGFSALDYGAAMASPAVAVMLKNPTVEEAPFGFGGAESSSGVLCSRAVRIQ
jgi:hypothetical protein